MNTIKYGTYDLIRNWLSLILGKSDSVTDFHFGESQVIFWSRSSMLRAFRLVWNLACETALLEIKCTSAKHLIMASLLGSSDYCASMVVERNTFYFASVQQCSVRY